MRKKIGQFIRKKAKATRKYWKGFNPIKLFKGYEKIVLTEEEKGALFLNTNCFETDVAETIISSHTGIPQGIVAEIINDAEYDIMGQVGLIHEYE